MSYSHLENRLKELGQYESKIDTTEVWARLEPKINTQDSKRKIFYFRIFGMSLLLLTLLGISFLFLTQNDAKTNRHAVHSESKIIGADQTKTSNYVAAQDESTSFSQIENKPAIQITNKSEISLDKKTKIERNVNQNNDLNRSIKKGEKPLELTSINNETEENTTGLIDKNSGAFRSTDSAKFRNSNSLENTQLHDRKFERSDKSTAVFISPFYKINSLQLNSLLVGQSSLITPTPIIEECPLVNKNNTKISFSIRPYADYDFPMTSLVGREADSNLETIRNQVESNYIGYSFGVELRAKTKSGIHVFTGYNQSLIRDRFDFSVEKDTMILLEDIIKNITINENQDSVITIGDSLVNARVIETGRRFANYKSIDIPVGFEFSKRVSKLEFGISAAALINLTFGATGSVYDENEEISSLDGKYKNSIGARFRLSTPIQYYIGRKLNIGIAPAFTYSPKSITSNTYPIDHKVNLFSMRLFADYSF